MFIRNFLFSISILSLGMAQLGLVPQPELDTLITGPNRAIKFINTVQSDSFTVVLFEGQVVNDTVILISDSILSSQQLDRLGDQELFQLSSTDGSGTILTSIFTDGAMADSLERDSLEIIYKSNLLERRGEQLQHLGPPSDSTDYFLTITGSRLIPNGLYKLTDFIGQLARLTAEDQYLNLIYPELNDTLYLRLFPTRYGHDWIELYSIEAIFAEMIADRDSVRHFLFTYPADSDTVYSTHYRFGGWARDTSGVLIIDGDTIQIFSSGSFVGLFGIEPGWNRFQVLYLTDTCRVESTISLFRPERFDPDQPFTQIDQTSIIPENNISIYRPDRWTVRFQGTPNGSAQFKIPSITGGYLPMTEIQSVLSEGTGIYEGTCEITTDDKCRNKPILFRLKGSDGQTVKARSTGRVTIAIEKQPLLLETNWNTTLVRHAPNGEILMILPAGIMLEGLVDLGRYWKVALSNHRTGFVARRAVSQLPSGRNLPQAGMYGISTEVDSGWVTLRFNLTEQIPFKIVQSTTPQKLALYFYRTRFFNEWTVYPDSCPLIDHYEWVAEDDDVLRFDIFLDTDQQWGYRGYYEENRFRFDIKVPPEINPYNPFEGLTFVLDAGHGGEHRGAVGPSGINEKDVNLVYAQYLGKMLQERGAIVIPTRQVDTTFQLYERMIIAREAQGDIFLWLHNNAPGSTRNPMEVSGTSTYYTSPQNWPFARAVYPHLVDLGLEPFGQVHRTYYITRQTDMIIFLVEGAFMTHPEDELFMLSDDNLKKLAAAVLNGIEEYLIRLSN